MPIDLYGVEGIPRFNVVVGDANADIFRFNFGDSFAGATEMDGFVELGDEDFSKVIRGRNTKSSNQSKLVEFIRVLAEATGGAFDVVFEVGVRNSLDRPIVWKGPYPYKQEGSNNGIINTRANGVYHRYRISTKSKNQWWSINGLVVRIEMMGETLR